MSGPGLTGIFSVAWIIFCRTRVASTANWIVPGALWVVCVCARAVVGTAIETSSAIIHPRFSRFVRPMVFSLVVVMRSCQSRKAKKLVYSTICFSTEPSSEWPASVSYSSSTGRPEIVAACKRAVILRACSGATRVSPSPVMKSTAGYFLPSAT